MLRDPRNNEVFYVGKGKGDRCFAHLNNVDKYQNASDEEKEKINTSNKIDRILDIRNSGKTTHIDIVAHGLDDKERGKDKADKEALIVESAVIDALGGVLGLTNIQSGHESSDYGICSVENIIAKYSNDKELKEFDPTHKDILLRINRLFSYNLTPSELYDITRTAWKISEKKATSGEIEYAYAIYDGIIQEVYKIQMWLKAGSTLNSRHANNHFSPEYSDRWEFVGQIAEDRIRNKYIHKRIDHIFVKRNRNPFMYVGMNNE